MKAQYFTDKLKDRLQCDLPGEAAHNRLKAVPRSTNPFTFQTDQTRASAVLILIFPENGRYHFFLTERTNTVEHHKGQVSLPGGVQEHGEPLSTTALRETEEEIGVQAKDIRVLGELTPLHTFVSGFIIHPYVGFIKNKPKTRPHAEEVAALHTVSFSELLDDSRELCEKRNFKGVPVDVPFFEFDSTQVWGATSMVLSEFKEIVNEVLNGSDRD